MFNIPQLYIIGDSKNSVDTPLGGCRFITVREYDKLAIYQEWIEKDKYEILDIIKPEYKKDIKEILDNITFFDFIKKFKELGLYATYQRVFQFFFCNEDANLLYKLQKEQENLVGKINLNSFQKDRLDEIQRKIKILLQKTNILDKVKNNDEFEFYRQLFRDMNCIKRNKKKNQSKNPKVNLFDKLEQIAQEQRGEVITIKSIIANVGLYRPDVLDMTIYSLYAYFDAINNNKNYRTATLFKTVDPEHIDIKPWYMDSSIEKTKLDKKDKEIILNQASYLKDTKPTKLIKK